MYNSTNTAERIKSRAKEQGIIIKEMLSNCGLNKNVLSTMISRGSWPQSNNLAIIADYLDCSVDYLLGRTNVPEINKRPVGKAADGSDLLFELLKTAARDGGVGSCKLTGPQLDLVHMLVASLPDVDNPDL